MTPEAAITAYGYSVRTAHAAANARAIAGLMAISTTTSAWTLCFLDSER